MNGLAWVRTGVLPVACMVVAGLSLPAAAFEKVALVDSLDFAKFFDVETAAGTKGVADYCASVGATALWWRSNGGVQWRYPSAIENSPRMEGGFEKLRLPGDDCYGWLRLDRGECDLMRCALDCIRATGLANGIHMSYEDSHWSAAEIGGWNLEHPEFWCRRKDGAPWPGRTSIAFPEVFARKLKLVDELLAYGPETLYIDTWRTGGWSVRYEYVKPMTDAWRRIYACEPPSEASDPRWLQLFAEHQHAFFRGVRKLIEKRGGKTRLAIALAQLDLKDQETWCEQAVDWRMLAAEGTIDAVVVRSVAPDRRRVWESTRQIYEQTVRYRGKADIYFPLNMYDYRPGIPSYVKWTGESRAGVARKLLTLAKETGAKGVAMECVDYRNYPDDVCQVIKEFK